MFLLPEVRQHLGVREVRFYLGNPVRRKQKWVYFYKCVSESVCGNFRRHSQSLLSGQGVRAVRPFRQVPENKKERRNQDKWLDNEDVWGISIVISIVLTSHTGGPLGPGNPAGPCGPSKPCKTAQKWKVNLFPKQYPIINTVEGFNCYLYRTRSPGGPGGPSLPELPCGGGAEKQMSKGRRRREI